MPVSSGSLSSWRHRAPAFLAEEIASDRKNRAAVDDDEDDDDG